MCIRKRHVFCKLWVHHKGLSLLSESRKVFRIQVSTRNVKFTPLIFFSMSAYRRLAGSPSLGLTTKTMDPRLWHKVAAVSGVAALGLGTYGAHMFKPKNQAYKEVWHTASLYHLVHTAALLAAPITKNPNIFGGLLTTGILAFSGTCYMVAYLEDRKYSFLAPFGGFAFIGAWASLLF